jgi:hypothetical protein
MVVVLPSSATVVWEDVVVAATVLDLTEDDGYP